MGLVHTGASAGEFPFSQGWVALDKSPPGAFQALKFSSEVWSEVLVSSGTSGQFQERNRPWKFAEHIWFQKLSNNLIQIMKSDQKNTIHAPLDVTTTTTKKHLITQFPFLKENNCKRRKQKFLRYFKTDFLGSDSVFSCNWAWIWIWLLAASPSPPATRGWWKVKWTWNSRHLLLSLKSKTQKPVLQNTKSIFTSTCNNILN